MEDNEVDARLTLRAAKQAGLANNIEVVTDGEMALQRLRREGPFEGKNPIDLVYLDLNLPKLSGHEVLAEMKADPAIKRIPVVVLTTSNARPDIESAYDNHAAAFITKPLDMEGFMEIARGTREFWVELVTVA